MRATGLATLFLLFVVGCGSHGRGLMDDDLSYKGPAIKEAVADDEVSALPELVKSLDSDDPAVRFFAIEGLRRLTNQTFGYNYYDDAPTRRPALGRWQAWLKQHPTPEPAP